MWRKGLTCAGGALKQKQWRMIASASTTMSLKSASTSPSPSPSVYSAVNSLILRSLKDHYFEVSKMTAPPKICPPSPFTVVKGALDSGGPVLKRSYNEEEVSVSVMRLANFIRGGGEDDEGDDGINQLFLHVTISKPGQELCLHFLCGLYPDALGIHSVSMRPKVETSGYLVVPTKYNGPTFEELDEKMRDAFHGYIEERGINESLFPFLQAWLYVKDHRDLIRWFKSAGEFIKDGTQQEALSA